MVNRAANTLTSIFIILLMVFLSACGKNKDNTAPSITLNGFNPVTICVGTPYIDTGATAFDETDGDLTDEITATINVDTSQPGEGSVVYEVSDEAGNTAQEVREVVIIFCD